MFAVFAGGRAGGHAAAVPDGLYLSSIEAAGDRVKMAGDVLDYTEFYVADQALPYDAAAVEKRITKPEMRSRCLPPMPRNFRASIRLSLRRSNGT